MMLIGGMAIGIAIALALAPAYCRVCGQRLRDEDWRR